MLSPRRESKNNKCMKLYRTINLNYRWMYMFFILYNEGLIFSPFLIKLTCSVMAALFLGSFELLAFSPALSQFKRGNWKIYKGEFFIEGPEKPTHLVWAPSYWNSSSYLQLYSIVLSLPSNFGQLFQLFSKHKSLHHRNVLEWPYPHYISTAAFRKLFIIFPAFNHDIWCLCHLHLKSIPHEFYNGCQYVRQTGT